MKQFAIFFVAISAIAAGATGLKSLELFIKSSQTGRADFSQVVTFPAKDGKPARVKTSAGTFEFARPNRFKFIYQQPFAQSIVADGQTLWLHDLDLNQVTAHKQATALGSTPAALIAAAPDVQALRTDFTLADAPDQDALQWVLATPKAKDSPLHSVRVGFYPADPATRQTPGLAALEILDSFGQRSRLTFSHFEVNPTLPASSFQFKIPPGADVIRQ